MDVLQEMLPEWIAWPGRYAHVYAPLLCLIPLIPLLGFLINALGRKSISRGLSGAVACMASAISFALSLICFYAMQQPFEQAVHQAIAGGDVEKTRYIPQALHYVYGSWIEVGGFSASFGFFMDQLSGTLTLIVTGVGTLIHIYSMGYMAHDKSYARFFCYLNLFLFSMLVLTLGDNLIMMFVGWEGVGLCSYLLIGFWYQERANAVAGMKAFIFNRIGDLGFLLGIFTLIVVYGTVNYVAPPGDLKTYAYEQPRPELTTTPDGKKKAILPKHAGILDLTRAVRHLGEGNASFELGRKVDAERGNLDLSHTLAADLVRDKDSLFKDRTVGFALMLACLMLFVGAMGKSAQIPLYAWLPDAMAGPTPVSALIHAATMVTAGVYMVGRLHPLFLCSETAMISVAIIGGCTAILAALMGLTQTDIKKVLAYSTVSQLGYMFLGAGVGAFGLAMFHVLTHAFFKALLFLGAGSVIHGMSHEQDMRNMGGLRRRMPVTFLTMLFGAVALAGVPFTAGGYSKDAILATVLAKAHVTHVFTYELLYGLAIVGAFCTAFYTFRLMGLTFFGENRAREEVRKHIHESPAVMTLPLIVLAVFSLIGGWCFKALPTFLGLEQPAFLETKAIHQAHVLNLIWSSLAAFGGIGLACFLYIFKGVQVKPEARQGFAYKLSLNKFYIEAFYDKVVTSLFAFVAEATHLIVDVFLIDFVMVGGVGFVTRRSGRFLRTLQSGLVNAYAAAMVAGALAVLYLFLRS